MGIRISTDFVHKEARTDVWRAATAPIFRADPLVAGHPLEGTLDARSLGPVMLGPTQFNAQSFTRDRRLILQQPMDLVMVHLVRSGRLSATCDGTEISLAPGEIGFFDLVRPFRTEVTPGGTIAVLIPRALLDRGGGLHGHRIGRETPLCRLLGDLLHGMAETADRFTPDEAQSVTEAALALLRQGLGGCEDLRPEAGALGRTLRARIDAYIAAHLFEETLGAERLMARFRISRAHLYRCYAPEGGVMAAIRDRRLDHVCQQLQRGGADLPETISEIGYLCGFKDATSFTRAFRRRFGQPPSAVRGTPAGGTAGPADLRSYWQQVARELAKPGSRAAPLLPISFSATPDPPAGGASETPGLLE